MKRAHRPAVHLRWAVLLLAAGCRDALPPYGEVTLLLSTDMSIPEGFDTLVLERKSGQRWVFAAGDIPSSDISGECGEVGNPDSTKLSLPTSIVLKSATDDSFSTELTLTACKAGKRVFHREFQVEFPEPGQQKMVRAPIRWLCSDWERNCYGCMEGDKLGRQSCYPESVSLLSDSKRCNTDACVSSDSDTEVFFKSVDYKPAEVAAYSLTTSGSSDACFDVSDAFTTDDKPASAQFAANRPWFHIPTQWHADNAEEAVYTCEGILSVTPIPGGEPLNTEYLNLALVLPQTETGLCNAERCLIPLEAQNAVGWQWKPGDDWNAKGERSVLLPPAVCHMLDSGQVLYVIGTNLSKQKGYKMPFCTIASPDTTQVKESVSGGTDFLAFSLDDQDAWYVPGQGMPRLEPSRGSISGLSVPTAVSGRAGRFTNESYAYFAGSLLRSRNFTIAAWASLTELALTESTESTRIMPLISDVSEDCQSGGRLELHATNDQSSVQIALGVPIGSDGSGQCSFEYTCALLGSSSYAGGYFTPWSTGNWYHVAATVQRPGTPVLYLDGAQANLIPCDPIASTPVQSHDASRFYLGSSKALADSGVPTHPLLIDEVVVSGSALDSSRIKQLSLYPRTVPGASGFRWGAWGGQGSFATLSTLFSLPVFSVTDAEFGTAGGFALLAEPIDLSATEPGIKTQDLSNYDELVLVADMPENRPLQLSLVAAHGQRQCVWQLFSKPQTASSPRTYSDNFIIDLRRPSWCVSPSCDFDLTAVESMAIGSDWKDAVEKHTYSVRALAFRQRSAETETPRTKSIGGKLGPNGWCWRAVSYDPRWDVAPVQLSDGAVTFPEPKATLFLSDYKLDAGVPELAADPPLSGQTGPRDLSTCVSLKLDLSFGEKGTSSNIEPGNAQFAMKDDRGYTCWFDLDTSSTVARIDLENQPLGVWGPGMPVNTSVAKEYSAIRHAVARISVRSEHALTVRSVQCCDAGDVVCRPLE